MIKIKDYIFNENEISHIIHMMNENLDTEYLNIFGKDGSLKSCISATFDDIEWNYVDKVHDDKLEKAYKKVKEELVFMTDLQKDSLGKRLELQHRIDKAIEYIESYHNTALFESDKENLIKILEGEENA